MIKGTKPVKNSTFAECVGHLPVVQRDVERPPLTLEFEYYLW